MFAQVRIHEISMIKQIANVVGLCGTLLILLCEGINAAIMGPLYPLRAIHYHGTSQFVVAVALAMLNIGQAIAGVLLLSFKTKNYIRFIFISSSLLTAILVIMFGLVDCISNKFIYDVLCITIRFLLGLSISGIWSMVFAVVTTFFGEIGFKLSNIFLFFFYTGLMIGPQFALYLSTFFNYSAPFYTLGILLFMFTFAAMTVFSLHESQSTEDENANSVYSNNFYAKDIGVIILLINFIYCGISDAFFDGILAQFFTEKLMIPSSKLNTAYILSNFSLLPSSFIFGWYLSSKGYSFMIVMGSLLLNFTSTFVLYLSKYFAELRNFYVACALLFLIFAARGTFVTSMYPVLRVYITNYFQNSDPKSVNVFVGLSLLLAGNLGLAIGALVFIGILKVYFGFYESLFGIWVFGAISISTFVYYFFFILKVNIIKRWC